jgi:hypothetical protein
MAKSDPAAWNKIFSAEETRDKIAAAKAELADYAALDAERARVVPDAPDGDDWDQQAPIPALAAGDWVSFHGSVILHVGDDLISSYSSMVTRFGMDLELTEPLLANNRQLWESIDNVSEQERRFRREGPLVSRGKWDERTPRWERGSVEEGRLRDIARAEAFKISDPDEQRRALRKADDLYGIAATSHTLAAYRGGPGR